MRGATCYGARRRIKVGPQDLRQPLHQAARPGFVVDKLGDVVKLDLGILKHEKFGAIQAFSWKGIDGRSAGNRDIRQQSRSSHDLSVLHP